MLGKIINIYRYCREHISVRQAQIEKLYAGLQDLCKERRKRLDETLQLYELHREIDDLLQWIADKEVLFFNYFHSSMEKIMFKFSCFCFQLGMSFVVIYVFILAGRWFSRTRSRL